MLFRNVLMLPYREFSSFKYSHLPSPFLKATYWKVWDEEGAVLDEVCKNRFRTVFDVNQYVMKYWQYMEGKFTPQSPKLGRFYTIGKHDQQIHHTIRRQACKMICLNDDVNVGDFEKQKKEIQKSFEVIFPEKDVYKRQVMGGLVSRPVIAVPTSVGYGANFHGLSALLTMINSCANGIATVNIDNGYGAGYLATQMNRLALGK